MGTHLGPRKVDKPLILYGKGRLGILATEIFDELKIPYRAIDRNSINMTSWTERQEGLAAVCVATTSFTSILGELTFKGFKDVVPVWDIIEAYPEIGIRNGWFINFFSSTDSRNINQVWSGFADERSRHAYSDFFTWRNGGTFFPEYTLSPNLGRYPFPLPSTLADIRQRQHANFTSYPDNSIYIHAEGHELQTIRDYGYSFGKIRPTVTVACYHSRDGLWKIQKTLMDNLIDYDFSFNMYAYQGQAAYFTCKPKGECVLRCS